MCVNRNDKVLYRYESVSILNMNEQCAFVWVCSGPLWTQLCCGDGRHSCLEQEVCRPEQQWLQPWPAPPCALSWLVCLCVSVCVSKIEGHREGKNRESTPIHHLNIHWGCVYKLVTCFVSVLRPLLIRSLSLCSLSFCSFSPLISSECLTPLNQSSGKWPTYLSFFPTSASTQQHTHTHTADGAITTILVILPPPPPPLPPDQSSLYLVSSLYNSPLLQLRSGPSLHLALSLQQFSADRRQKHWDESRSDWSQGTAKYCLQWYVSSNRHQFERMLKFLGRWKNSQIISMFIKQLQGFSGVQIFVYSVSESVDKNLAVSWILVNLSVFSLTSLTPWKCTKNICRKAFKK